MGKSRFTSSLSRCGSRRAAHTHRFRAGALALVATAVAAAAFPLTASADRGAGNLYRQTNLVSDIPGVAQLTDPNLVNPWGLAAGPTSPAWVADNGADVATIYRGAVRHTPVSIASLVVGIPGGAPTGEVFNPTDGFVVKSGLAMGPAMFLFASESGNITGWNATVPPPSPSTQAQPAVHTPDAVYKGLAIANAGGKTYIYATDFHNDRIDVFDSQFAPASLGGQFRDPRIPAGYAPFGIQAFDHVLLVSYAKQDADRHDDQAGPGNGFVDAYDTRGHLLRRLISRGQLNSPWGLALAPGGFGVFSHALLVGNFGDGSINAYSPLSGRFLGRLRTRQGPITIDGLWALRFGNGVTGSPRSLLFTAGLNHEDNGLFGVIRRAHR